MATGGVTFLQANVEDGPKALGSYRPGNTDMIRKMLREQQRECQALHANPLLKEVRAPALAAGQTRGRAMHARASGIVVIAVPLAGSHPALLHRHSWHVLWRADRSPCGRGGSVRVHVCVRGAGEFRGTPDAPLCPPPPPATSTSGYALPFCLPPPSTLPCPRPVPLHARTYAQFRTGNAVQKKFGKGYVVAAADSEAGPGGGAGAPPQLMDAKSLDYEVSHATHACVRTRTHTCARTYTVTHTHTHDTCLQNVHAGMRLCPSQNLVLRRFDPQGRVTPRAGCHCRKRQASSSVCAECRCAVPACEFLHHGATPRCAARASSASSSAVPRRASTASLS